MPTGLWLLLTFGPFVALVVVLGALALNFVLTAVRAGTREPGGITSLPWLNAWWDGRHVRHEPLSPDGNYWWDGAAWRPTPKL